ncbi:SDR family oxidoreductase [Jiella sp. M17.18]|uniref:SDR family oxidoreductase n=1 Tax=Jiella sp. M17.18 TaxID=3234247 RepID=UPI0034DFDDD9
MRIFVTGATGFIGSATVPQLIAAGHQVLGLCRSPDKAAALEAAGAEVLSGSITDSALLTEAAANCDAVIHLAFNHDFSTFVQNCEDDRRVIAALGAGLQGSDRPLLVTSGTAITIMKPGRPAREDDPIVSAETFPRAATEEAAAAVAGSGVNVGVVRLPQVHDPRRQGLVSYLIMIAREKGFAGLVGDGSGRWAAGHVSDVARLYRLAIERGEPGARYHAVGEEGVSLKAMTETYAKRLGLPVRPVAPADAEATFGWMARFMGHDMPASSEKTRRTLGWEPTGPGMLADLERLEV